MYNILLAGVGGQGTVLASKLLAACAIARGEDAHTAETIGMAQRGGSVVSHVRTGTGAYSPLIPKGHADVIIAFEPAEAVRSLAYLKKGGAVITSSLPVKPVTDSLSEGGYSGDEMLEYLKTLPDISLSVVDTAAFLKSFGSAKALNIALLGAAVKTGKTGCTRVELETAIKSMVKPQFVEMNLGALEFFD